MPKKIPMRTCVGCGTVRPKKKLIRVVMTPEGEILPDKGGRAGGRGAYLCNDPACLERALRRRSLQRAFRVPQSEISAPDRLREEIGGTDAG